MRYLTFALAKGRLAKKTLAMFEQMGITCEEAKDPDTRKLIFTNEEHKIRFFLAKASDVPTYVEYGAADIGVVGKDTIMEEGRDLYEVMDLGFGKCRMCVCGPESAKELFLQDEEHRTPAELALKWLYDQPEVTCVLSGMNSMEMVEQNVKTASESLVGCLTQSDQELIEKVKDEIKKNVKVGCTGCGYCMPCPKGVDIPGTFRCYNAMYSEGKKSGRRDYLQCTAFRKDTSSASQCISCGKCEKHCPQHIEIRKELKNAAAELEDVKYKVMKTGIQLLKLW